jgi:cellobiose-specific phosphotransferase system component IIA
MENPKLTAASESLARAVKLSREALNAAAAGDGRAIGRLVAEARGALSEAALANNDLLVERAANDKV